MWEQDQIFQWFCGSGKIFFNLTARSKYKEKKNIARALKKCRWTASGPCYLLVGLCSGLTSECAPRVNRIESRRNPQTAQYFTSETRGSFGLPHKSSHKSYGVKWSRGGATQDRKTWQPLLKPLGRAYLTQNSDDTVPIKLTLNIRPS